VNYFKKMKSIWLFEGVNLRQPVSKTKHFQSLEIKREIKLMNLGLREMEYLSKFNMLAKVFNFRLIGPDYNSCPIVKGLRKGLSQSTKKGQKGGPQLERLT